MVAPVQIRCGHDGTVETPFGPLDTKGFGEVVSMGVWLVAAALRSPLRMCRTGTQVLGAIASGTASRDGKFIIYTQGGKTLVYELYPAEWADQPEGKPYIYLGVRRATGD